MSVNLFVTGRPGVGKTTLLAAVLDRLSVEAGGFFTREIRGERGRLGFSIEDLAGETGVLAHVDLASEYRVGRYGVNRSDLERVGVAALESAIERSELIVMDEIGRMELCSRPFRDAVIRALDSAKPVLGTIQDRQNEFLNAVRARADVVVLRVTQENRDAMVGELLRRLDDVLGGRAAGTG